MNQYAYIRELSGLVEVVRPEALTRVETISIKIVRLFFIFLSNNIVSIFIKKRPKRKLARLMSKLNRFVS